jgi:hypothetical protein
MGNIVSSPITGSPVSTIAKPVSKTIETHKKKQSKKTKEIPAPTRRSKKLKHKATKKNK